MVQGTIGVHGAYYQLFIWVSFALGLAGTFDVISQPRAAFRAAGHSKLRWMLIEAVGFLFLFGIVTWSIYSFAVRPFVVKAGGRPRAKARIIGDFFDSFTNDSPGPMRGPLGGGGAGPNKRSERELPWGDFTSNPTAVCSACRGSGYVSCTGCSGTGHDSYYSDGFCPLCSGSGTLTCSR